MYIDDQTYKVGKKNKKTYRRVLLRDSFREGGKVKHHTIANLSKLSDDEIAAMKLALKHKGNLAALADVAGETKTKQGASVGAVWLLHQLAKRLGIIKALGQSRSAKLVLWMVYARLIRQGSRLSAVRLARRHAVCDILGMDGFTEDDLYEAMDWLNERQETVEDRLFAERYDEPPSLYLYDVTSSYLEGQCNELGDYGYNRDKKAGKKQIVIGLLTDETGRPVSVEVFRGNTSDLSTFSSQTDKVKQRFTGKGVTFVGDRGMIKGPQIDDLPEDFHFITAITKAQINKMLKDGVLQPDLFDEKLFEVQEGAYRYILRRNPNRRLEMAQTRRSKRTRVERLVQEKNVYLSEHPRAQVKTAVNAIYDKLNRLKIGSWLTPQACGRKIDLVEDPDVLAEVSKLDGCYVIKTDLEKEAASAETVHGRYKDLAEVEWGFRTMKTVFLEMRAIYVRKACRTRAHVFIVMLAYLLSFELRRLWSGLDMTVEEGIHDLGQLCATEVHIKNQFACQTIPQPRESGRRLLKLAGVELPPCLPCKKANVHTKVKLQKQRLK